MPSLERPLRERGTQRARRSAPLVLVCAVLAMPGPSIALQNEPDGFGKAKFGMSIEAVQKSFPDMRKLGEAPQSPLQIYAVENQSFAGLRPCKATFSFLTNELYETKLDCGSGDSVKAALYETFGQPSVEEAKMAIWRGEHAVVTMNRQTKTFAFANLALVSKLNQYLVQKALVGGAAAVPQPPPARQPHGSTDEEGKGSVP
jgi:hypothetical protein